jgi:hypothetical protein
LENFFHAGAADSKIVVALGTLAAALTQAHTKRSKIVTLFLVYAASHPDASQFYFPSEIILH